MRAEEYIRSLPDGRASYPECAVKASVARSFLQAFRRAKPDAPLSDPLRRFGSMPAITWVPVTTWVEQTCAMREAFDSDAAFFSMVDDGNRELLSGPLYRVLFVFASPSLLTSGAGDRWHRFHRGSTLESHAHPDRKGASVWLRYPPRLFNELYAYVLGSSFLMSLEAVRAKQPTVDSVEYSDTSTRYELRWC